MFPAGFVIPAKARNADPIYVIPAKARNADPITSFPRRRESRYPPSAESFTKAGQPLSRGEARILRGGWVYIMADRYRGTLYIGVTSNIAARAFAHREGQGSRFCRQYGLKRLVYAEEAPTIEEAIAREKAMKKWSRAWKIDLIESANPDWLDLFETII